MESMSFEERRVYKIWYRALTPDGRLWIETADLAELQAICGERPDLSYERDIIWQVEGGYQPFDPWAEDK